MTDAASRIILMVCNAAAVIWVFWIVEPEKPVCRGRYAAAYVALVLLRLPLYIYNQPFRAAWMNTAVRFMPCVIYLRLSKRLGWNKCIYFSFITWFGFTMASILRGTWVYGAVSEAFIHSGILDTMLARCIDVAVVMCLSRFIPLNDIRRIGPERMCMMAFLVICELYIIQTVSTKDGMGWMESTLEIKIYLFLMQVFAACGLVMFERNLTGRAKWEQAKMAELDSRYRYKALQERQAAESDVRRLHHDMKNHLLAIRRMVNTPEEQEKYIDGLLESELSTLEKLPQTGNDLLNGLLGEKMLQAEKGKICLMVELDFRPCAYMDGADICAIFGNIVDNAMEAVRSIENQARRIIRIRSEQAAENLIILCSNPYTGVLKPMGHGFASSKKGSGHGIGLSSVQRAVEKYGGIVTLDTECDGVFSLILMLPIRKEDENLDMK